MTDGDSLIKGGDSAQSLQKGRAAWGKAEWGRAEEQPAHPHPGWGTQGPTPHLPSCLLLRLLLAKPKRGSNMLSRMRRVGACGQAQGRPSGAGLPPAKTPVLPVHHVSVFNAFLCAGLGVR